MVFPLETIVNILTNKNYIGIDTYGDLVNECPKLVDKKIFDSVQMKVSRKKGQKPNVKHDKLLKGFCGDGTPRELKELRSREKTLLFMWT